MGRSNRQTADYFPHYVGEKSRTKFILEKNWGNDGYAFWFKLLELLCAADGQYYDCWDKMGWEYLLAVTGVTAETAEAILNTLASMGKVDKELWESCRVIWVQSLLENLRQLYSKRTAAPTKPSVDNFPGRRVESPAQEPAAASKFVTEFNSKFEETEKAKDTFADNVAKMETDFDEKMGEIETRMSKTVQNMEMTDEARKAAQDTIKAYCDAIRSMTGEAGSAAEAVANAAASHLKTAPTTTPTTTTVAGHANGTLSAQEDVYIAGEAGPELIIGARGSEVFPTQETERILAAVNSTENAPDDTAPEPTASPLPENDLPEGMEAVKEYSYLTADGQGSDAQPTGIEYVEPEVQVQTTEEAAPAEEAPVNTTAPATSDAQQEAPASSSDAPSIGETVKRIIIEINGSGSIDVGGMNEESVLDILTRHAKPVLMSIIKGEIFEEGDLAYDF